MKLLRRRPPYILVVDRPSGDLVEERIQLFAGFVQSSEPVPHFDLTLNGVLQDRVRRAATGDPSAPPELRHTTYWNFYCEAAAVMSRSGRIDLDVVIGGRRVARRRFWCGTPRDRTSTGRPLVFFMHIPKTAGTALRFALERHAPPLRLLHVYDKNFLDIDRYRSFSPAASDDLDVVVGHFEYGLHASSTRRPRYVTFLRRPAAFVKSYYLFDKYRHRGMLSNYPSIDAAIEHSGFDAFDNLFTRFLVGRMGGDPVTEADFAVAARRMEEDFAFVGHVDDMQGALRGLGTLLGVPLQGGIENAMQPTPETDTIELADLDARFGERWRFDEQLCAMARRRFDPARVESLAPLPAAADPVPSRPGSMRRLRDRLGKGVL